MDINAVETREFRFPEELLLLQEINLPDELAETLLGRTVPVEIVPEERAATRQVERDEYPQLMAPDGTLWNCERPMQVSFRDASGGVWRIPRHWVTNDVPVERHICYNVTREHVFFWSSGFSNTLAGFGRNQYAG